MASNTVSLNHRKGTGSGGRVQYGFAQVACLVVLSIGLFATRRALLASEYRSLRRTGGETAYREVDDGEVFGDEPSMIAPVEVSPDEFKVGRLRSSDLAHLTQPEDTPLQIALLMSYPNSGTSYTIKLIRHVSLTYTASNYAHENKDKTGPSLPVFRDQPNGPFWLDPEVHPEYSLPTSFVLTKTHCGMRCVVCPPNRYVETTFSFRRRCFTGKRSTMVLRPNTTAAAAAVTLAAPEAAAAEQGRHAASYEEVEYEDRRVSKAVHLIRNPFDNVVSRFHMERHDGKSATEYPATREGFRWFCQRMNDDLQHEESKATFLGEDVMDILRDVPCRSDFIRYVEWHNLAFATTHDLGLETFVLHYDTYTTDFNGTVASLLKFLNLESRAEPEPFIRGKEYLDYFADSERDSVRKAFMILASKTAWKEMEQYF
jgi:Sulfotransferase domain